MTGSYNEGFRKAPCAECTSSFNLLPPADEEYHIPKERPRGEDYIKRLYECELNHHPNIIYWQKADTGAPSSDSSSDD
jgi:hypothetical protein